jgi:hypothetical protein
MLQKKAKRGLRDATRACVKKEMAEPRITKSARKEYAKFALKMKRKPLELV